MTFVLPDPHDEDWSGCMIAYCAARSTTLRKLEMVRRRIDQVDQRITAAENAGDDINDLDFRREMVDRLHLLTIIQNADRNYLLALRSYLDLCRVVHGKIDRQRYDTIHELLRLGIPPNAARKMAEDGFVVPANQT